LLQDVVVAYDSLLLRFQHPQLHAEVRINESLKQLANITLSGSTISLIEIPVCYDQALYNDLSAMAEQTNLTVEEIIELHSAATYHIYMLGFLPGFAYLGSVDDRPQGGTSARNNRSGGYCRYANGYLSHCNARRVEYCGLHAAPNV